MTVKEHIKTKPEMDLFDLLFICLAFNYIDLPKDISETELDTFLTPFSGVRECHRVPYSNTA